MKAISLTNSSTVHKRKASDFYPTPADVTRALLDTGVVPTGTIWEPACGEGHMVRVLSRHAQVVISTDIRTTDYPECSPYDFLSETRAFPVGSFDAIITNPPFKLSVEFIKTALAYRPKLVAMLLKSQYWHSQKRASLFAEYPPAYIFALTWRPDFCFGDRGGNPPMECLWTVWIEGQTDTRYRVLRRPAARGHQ